MSINASARELHTAEYARRIAEVLRAHHVPPNRLTIEVTEHAAAVDANQLVDRLGELRASGVRVALDDFGSEYSSLKLLRTLPVDALKIDRELLDSDSRALASAADRAGADGTDGADSADGTDGADSADGATGRHAPIVDVVVTIGRRLGLDVVAEGVSTAEQRAMLVECGCRYAQGELFGGPMPAERVEAQFPGSRAYRHVGEVDSRREIRHG
jgi:EAL domain-containing protein (putative c-di-GMP-specific phosphodiesterase class I)